MTHAILPYGRKNMNDTHDLDMSVDEVLDWYCSDMTVTQLLKAVGPDQLATDITFLSVMQNITFPKHELKDTLVALEQARCADASSSKPGYEEEE